MSRSGGSPRPLDEVVADGDRRESLEAVRDRLAKALVEVDDRYVAPIAKQLNDVLRELDSLVPPEVSKVDDLRDRRAARRAKAEGAKRPRGGDVSGARSG